MFLAVSGYSAALANVLPDIRDIRLKGYVGDRLDACIANHVAAKDGTYLTDPFKWRSEYMFWQTEFWGKWMHSAVPLADYANSAKLRGNIKASLANLLPSQLPDGYLGNYAENVRCRRSWDVWGQKYTMLGLVLAYDLTGDKAVLKAAEKMCDYLISVFGPGKNELRKSSQYGGMPSCSVLEPVVWLYNRTKEPRYLEFAKYIVSELNDHEDSMKLVDDALAGIDVADRTPWAAGGYEGQNKGHKAYEMMSCYQGLVEYALATGERKYVDAAVATAKSIINTELNICGGATSIEHWYGGAKNQVYPYCRQQETCVLTTWIRLCAKLLEVTGDPLYADQMEKTFYNAYLASLKMDNSYFASYTPLAGCRSRGQYHCRMHTACCNENGPRGFVSYLESALQADGRSAIMNLYASSTMSVKIPDIGEKVTFETFTLYPAENRVEIYNRTRKTQKFSLKLRIPSWSRKTAIYLNYQPVDGAAVKPGEYYVLDREWKQGDSVIVDFDFSTVSHVVDHHVAFTRGPIVLARDMRFHDGDIGEIVRRDCRKIPGAVPFDGNIADGMKVAAKSVRAGNKDMWMVCSIPLPMGTHRENPENNLLSEVRFCDFASAGNTWDPTSSYRVWLPIERFHNPSAKCGNTRKDEMKLAPIFSDGIVFAIGKPIRVFGTGDGVAEVFLGERNAKVRSYDGKWCVVLPPVKEADGPLELRVKMNGKEHVVKDVRFGEVLIMAGQSNMDFPLKESVTKEADWVSDNGIRAFFTTKVQSGEGYSATNGWMVLDRTNAGNWSAIAYETAVRRAKATGRPVGVIHCCQGASAIKAWLPETVARQPRLQLPPEMKVHDDSRSDYSDAFNKTGVLYRRQFSEIVPYSATATVWYQGESNTGSVAEGEMYKDLLSALIGQWRLDLGDFRLPFVVVEIASYPYDGDPNAWCRRDAWEAVQKSQRQIGSSSLFVKTVRSEDVCEADKGIHPPLKWRLAERIAEALSEFSGDRP